MSDHARDLIRSLATNRQLTLFAARLRNWLLSEPNEDGGEVNDYTESRARAVLRATEAIDDPTVSDFSRLMDSDEGLRVALCDLLQLTELESEEAVKALAAISARTEQADAPQIQWLSLVLAAFAWQRGYPLAQLDPSSPPERYSPAGQVVGRAGAFLRQQIQRGATERERIARRLAPRTGDAASLEEMQPAGTIAPLPPYFRLPVPVRYPEVSRETLSINPDDEPEQPAVTRGEALVITEEDISNEAQEQEASPERNPPIRMPAIRISRDQVQPSQSSERSHPARSSQPPSPMPSSAVVMPTNTSESRPGLTVSLRQMFGSENMTSTKLRVVAQEYPDGPGVYGLQVKVTCKGIKSYVAGTTDRDGRFLAELPVRKNEGLTYDVDITWPRELGGETERKSLTLHADRTEFVLPFYVRLERQAGSEEDEQAG